MRGNDPKQDGMFSYVLPKFSGQPKQPLSTPQAISAFEPLLDDKQAVALLGGMHPKTLQKPARTGKIPAYRVGRSWRYRASELDKWLQSKLNSAGQPARVDFTKEIEQ
jgi:excisionase family DNA binding protein